MTKDFMIQVVPKSDPVKERISTKLLNIEEVNLETPIQFPELMSLGGITIT